jgi:hypothetical protein
MSIPNWWGDWRPGLTPHTGNLQSTDLIECTQIVGGQPVNTAITGAQIIAAASGGSGLTVGTTGITSGTIGRVLFQGTGNVLQQSANLFWDNTNSRLGIGTASPSATLHTVGSITASGGNARGNYMQPTLVASANNNILVGLDIAPTFTNGAFTGVQNISLRLIGASNRSMSLIAGDSSGNAYITNDITTQMTYTAGYGGHIFRFRDATNSSYPLYVAHNLVHGGNLSTSLGSSSFRWLSIFSVNISADTYQFQGTNAMSFLGAVNTGIYFDLTNKHLNIFTNNSQIAKLFSTGNVAIGTTTDAGYKLDVNGTTRIQSKLSVGTPSAASAVMEVTSTTQGFLPPRMTNAQMLAIATPAAGLVVYDTTNNKHCGYNGTAWQNFY